MFPNSDRLLVFPANGYSIKISVALVVYINIFRSHPEILYICCEKVGRWWCEEVDDESSQEMGKIVEKYAR